MLNASQEALIGAYFDLKKLRAALEADSIVALHDAYAAAETVLRRRGGVAAANPLVTLEAAYRSVSNTHSPGDPLYLFLCALELLDTPDECSAFAHEFAMTRAGRAGH